MNKTILIILILTSQVFGIEVPFKSIDTYLAHQSKDGKYEKFFVKGVNIGFALPGKFFTDFPKDKNIYYEWFKEIKRLNANTVRIYTIVVPEFYQALLEFNEKNKKSPLYLIQGVWLTEEI